MVAMPSFHAEKWWCDVVIEQ